MSERLPLNLLNSKILNPKSSIKAITPLFSPTTTRKNILLNNFNNKATYYSTYRNKKYYNNSNLKSYNKNYNFINNKKNIKKFFCIKNHNSCNSSYNKRKNIFENSKNNSIKEDKKNIFINKTSSSNIQHTNGKETLKTVKNYKDKEREKKLYFLNHNKIQNFISPRKLILNTQIIISQKTSKSSANSSKDNIRKKIFPKIPRIINPNEFKILNQIGSGSFGKIYKTIWNEDKEKYVMKIIKTQNKENITIIKETIRMIINFEQKTKCDGLIKIYGDSYTKKGEDYYYYEIMELAEKDWEKEINIRKRNMKYYSEWELFNIMDQLVKTLSLLQKNHITHRDIKLQNILLIKNKLKICDFGEARKLIRKGTILQPVRGSELYMSPVQFFGLNQKMNQVQHNTYKSDVFSLGMCILYAATLNDNCLYEIRELTNMTKISKILEKYLYKKYSIGFIKLLLCLLEINEKKRPDFIQLEKIITQIKEDN